MCFPAPAPSGLHFSWRRCGHDFLVKHEVWPLTCSLDWRNPQAFKPANNFSRLWSNSTLCSTFLPRGQHTYSSSALGEQFSEKQQHCGVWQRVPERGVPWRETCVSESVLPRLFLVKFEIPWDREPRNSNRTLGSPGDGHWGQCPSGTRGNRPSQGQVLLQNLGSDLDFCNFWF